jgi:hypothetical protein
VREVIRNVERLGLLLGPLWNDVAGAHELGVRTGGQLRRVSMKRCRAMTATRMRCCPPTTSAAFVGTAAKVPSVGAPAAMA